MKSKLLIPVENPGDEPLTLLLRIESDPGRSLSGKIAIAPHSIGDLAIWIEAHSPRAMGMIAGPSLAAGGLEPHTSPVTATEGSIDASHVTSVRLGISRPAVAKQLVVGPLQTERPSDADRTGTRPPAETLAIVRVRWRFRRCPGTSRKRLRDGSCASCLACSATFSPVALL